MPCAYSPTWTSTWRRSTPLAGQSEEHDRLTAAFAALARLDRQVRGIAENIFHTYGLADAGFTAGVIFAAVDPTTKETS
jgi:hypothetical protein